MIKQIYKILWNKRASYIWIFLEQTLVFTILLFCFLQIINMMKMYLDEGNLSIKNVFMIGIMPNSSSFTDEGFKNFRVKLNEINEKIKHSDAVEVYHSGFATVPLNRPASINFQDSLVYNGQKYKFYIKMSDENFPKVFNPKMISGTWFKDEPFADGLYPAIVTETLVKDLGVSEPIGMRLSFEGRDFRVVGVMPDFKTRTYDRSTATAIFAMSAFKDTRFYDNAEEAILVKEGRKSDFSNLFWKEALSAFPNEGHQPICFDMEELNKLMNMESYLMLFVIIIPTIFLIVFAFLGTFSLMYRQSQRSFGEYGLRIALGSTKNGLTKLVLLQGCLLTSIAIIIGALIGVNIYLLVYPETEINLFLLALMLAVFIMLLFSVISVWYPAYKAGNIQPALALKLEE